MLAHFKAADATDGFRQGFAEAVAKEFIGRYKPQTTNPARASPVPTVVALMVLKTYDHPSSLPCFKAALKDPAASVRLAAADGLLAAKIPAADWKTLLSDLQQAAMAEADPVTLGRLCQVITKAGGPPTSQTITALLKILDARFTRFETQGEFPARADTQVVTWLAAAVPGINNAEIRNSVVRRIARLLADAVHVYINEAAGEEGEESLQKEVSEARRNELQWVIAEAELQLRILVKPAEPRPDVTAAFFEKNPQNRHEQMTRQIGLWIGSDQGAGVLNGAPFNFERGLNIKRTPAATRPAPEPADQ